MRSRTVRYIRGSGNAIEPGHRIPAGLSTDRTRECLTKKREFDKVWAKDQKKVAASG